MTRLEAEQTGRALDEQEKALRGDYVGYGQNVQSNGGNGEVRAIYKSLAWGAVVLFVGAFGGLFAMQLRTLERLTAIEVRQNLIPTGCPKP